MRKVKLKFRFLVDDNGMLKGDTDLFRNCLKKYARKYVDVILQDAPNQKEIKEDRKRSLRQNAYYWGFMVPKMRTFYTEFYGEEISKDDIHSYNVKSILGEDFMIKEVLSVPIISRTNKTPSQMNTKEFANFIKEAQKLWAEHGLYIPDQDIYFGDLNENKNGN